MKLFVRAALESFPCRENRELLNNWKALGLVGWFFWEQTGNGSSSCAGGHRVEGMGGKFQNDLAKLEEEEKYDEME